MSTRDGDVNKLSGYSKEQYENWDNKVRYQKVKYIKIVQDTGVFCF